MHADTQFYNLNTAYSTNLAPRQMSLTGAFNYSHNQMDTIASIALGPTAAVSKTFLDKKLRSNLSVTFNNSYHNGSRQSRVLSLRAGGSYTLFEKHNLNLNMAGLNRNSRRAEGAQSFLEFTSTLTIVIGFE